MEMTHDMQAFSTATDATTRVGADRLKTLRPLAQLVQRTWAAYWDWQGRRATVLILQSLDARALKDIGINPSEIHSQVYGKPEERARKYHDGWQ